MQINRHTQTNQYTVILLSKDITDKSRLESYKSRKMTDIIICNLPVVWDF
uniref:Uncharacterized protein n=1 Tax=Anguilla anguilla TaxID=7936 RepID=A0A0E9PFJ0_ANGAN